MGDRHQFERNYHESFPVTERFLSDSSYSSSVLTAKHNVKTEIYRFEEGSRRYFEDFVIRVDFQFERFVLALEDKLIVALSYEDRLAQFSMTGAQDNLQRQMIDILWLVDGCLKPIAIWPFLKLHGGKLDLGSTHSIEPFLQKPIHGNPGFVTCQSKEFLWPNHSSLGECSFPHTGKGSVKCLISDDLMPHPPGSILSRSIQDTVRGFKELLEGEHDDLPEEAFYMVGTIEQAIEKAQRMSSTLSVTSPGDASFSS